MNRIPVVSSNLSSIGYDANSQTLEVAFRTGGVYRYFHVPASTYRALMHADSHGQYFDRYVKKQGYLYQRVASW